MTNTSNESAEAVAAELDAAGFGAAAALIRALVAERNHFQTRAASIEQEIAEAMALEEAATDSRGNT